MPPKTATSQGHLKVKRHKSITFLSVDYPLNLNQVKSLLITTIKHAPDGIHTTSTGDALEMKNLTSDNIELARIEVDGKSKSPQIIKVENEKDLQDKVLLWRIEGDEFHVEEYPDDEEQEADGP